MIHVISHGGFGESVFVYHLDRAEAESEIWEYMAAHPAATFGPLVPRVTGHWGAHGANMVRLPGGAP